MRTIRARAAGTLLAALALLTTIVGCSDDDRPPLATSPAASSSAPPASSALTEPVFTVNGKEVPEEDLAKIDEKLAEAGEVFSTLQHLEKGGYAATETSSCYFISKVALAVEAKDAVPLACGPYSDKKGKQVFFLTIGSITEADLTTLEISDEPGSDGRVYFDKTPKDGKVCSMFTEGTSIFSATKTLEIDTSESQQSAYGLYC